MKYIASIVCFVSLLVSYGANALSTSIDIEYLTLGVNGDVIVSVEQDVICNNPFVYFDESTPGFDRIFAMLLMYQALEKEIRINYTCGDDGKPIVSTIKNSVNQNADKY